MTSLHYVQEGSGPIVFLSHALGSHLGMWDGVAANLKNRFTVIRYDHRGHGKSKKSQTAFSINDMADDVASLIRTLSPNEKVSFVGLSMGGMVAQSLAARYSQLLNSIVIANSAEYYDDNARKNWNTRIEVVSKGGIKPISEAIISRWFTPEFINIQKNNPNDLAGEARLALENSDSLSYAHSCSAVSSIDFRISNTTITIPTLIIAGARDEATPPSLSQAMHQKIKSSRMIEINAAHLSAIEAPKDFIAALNSFL